MATDFKITKEVVLLLVVLGFAAITTTTAECDLLALPSLDNIVITDLNLSPPVNAKYACRNGYKQTGGSFGVTCNGSNWVWDNGQLSCLRVRCGAPINIDHAHYLEVHFLFGDTVNYICDTGYEQDKGVKDVNSITCQDDATWSALNFTCGPVTCPALAISHGTVQLIQGTVGKYQRGDQYRITCDRAFVSKDRPSVDVTCGADGKWSEENIVCSLSAAAAQCDPAALPVVSNSTYFNVDQLKGTALYYCHWGHIKTGSHTITCVGTTWVWDVAPLVCTPKPCGTPPHVDHATFRPQLPNYHYAQTVVYSCDDGYEQVPSGLIGDNSQCTEYGWSAMVGGLVCVPRHMPCPALPSITAADLSLVKGRGNYQYRSEYKYRCWPGFRSKGRIDVYVTCLPAGKWSEENVECKYRH